MSREEKFQLWQLHAKKFAEAYRGCLVYMDVECREKILFADKFVECLDWFKHYFDANNEPAPEKVTAVVKEKSTGQIVSITEFKNGTQEKN